MKSQIKMFETISVLIVFFFLLSLGMVFYFYVQRGRIQTGVREKFQLETMNIIQRINYLPELQCSFENIPASNCLDIVKLDAFSQVGTTNKLFYHSLFSTSNIVITQVYPSRQVWRIYSNQPQDGKWIELSNSSIPILLYNTTDRRYNTGILTVEVFK